jgi:hypothetical protein
MPSPSPFFRTIVYRLSSTVSSPAWPTRFGPFGGQSARRARGILPPDNNTGAPHSPARRVIEEITIVLGTLDRLGIVLLILMLVPLVAVAGPAALGALAGAVLGVGLLRFARPPR